MAKDGWSQWQLSWQPGGQPAAGPLLEVPSSPRPLGNISFARNVIQSQYSNALNNTTENDPPFIVSLKMLLST